MSFREYIKKALEKTIYESKTVFIYEYDAVKQGEGQIDPEVTVFTKYSELDKSFRRIILPYPLINPMFYRFKHPAVKLLTIHNETELFAFGWIQLCKHYYKKSFGDFVPDAMLLGPYWTNPDWRGKGYYGRLMLHSLALVEKDRKILISTRTNNYPSIRGIEKSGFRLNGCFKRVVFLYFFGRKTFKQI
ncbi:GNAT family N-acetyltransferase [candidate division KSB1 bacterium]|nr:GNAT family N-acetyltransferase [candidate division KSB1 bacterium]